MFREAKAIARCADDVRVVCWSHDERRVLVSISGAKHEWKPVEYVGNNPDTTMNTGYVNVNGKRVCVFA